MSFYTISIYAAIFVLTAASPRWSLLLFVAIAPWNIVGEQLGSDPRLGWSLLLAFRASFTLRSPSARSLPRLAIGATLAFGLLAFLRLQAVSGDLPAEELKSAHTTLLYFLSGASGAFAILKLIDTKEKLAQLIGATTLSLVAASGLGLFQAHTSYFLGWAEGRISGPLGNPNYFAAYLAFGAVLMMLAWRLELAHRFWLLIAVTLASATCVLTFSRMGTVACCLGLTLTLGIRSSGRVLNWRLMASSVIVLGLVASVTLGYLADFRRAISFSDDPHQVAISVISQGLDDLTRLEALQFALQEWQQRPFFGVGLATIAARNYMANGLYVTTHNSYLQALAGTGVIGSGLITLTVLSLIGNVAAPIRRYLMPFCVVVGLCCFFADFLGSIETFVLFATILAMLRCYRAPSELAPLWANGLRQEISGCPVLSLGRIQPR